MMLASPIVVPRTTAVRPPLRKLGPMFASRMAIREAARVIAEQRLRVAVKHAPIAVSTCDRELRYTWIANPDKTFPGPAALGRRDDELMPPESVEELMAFKWEVLESGDGDRREVAIRLPDGDHHFDVTAAMWPALLMATWESLPEKPQMIALERPRRSSMSAIR